MGKAEEVEKKPKKKKGRPSLLDLQKRRIKELQQQQLLLNQNKSNPISTTRRRSTRRNPQSDDDDDHSRHISPSGKFDRNSDSEDVGDGEAEGSAVMKKKKRTINAIVDGSSKSISSSAEIRKVEKLVSGGTSSNTNQGITTLGNDKKGTSLPDKKLLVFILDRLEKKDTYGVFSEPVDPEELPDYHEVIKHPMDFSTVKKKLDGGEYANLESFESDVFLICSNAMQYNAPETVYFRQARSIQELAEKSFDNLRRDSDADEDDPEPKRRGRPPTKHLKKPVGRPPLDRAGSENALGATLATGKESAMWSNYDHRKSSASPMENAGSRDSGGRSHLDIGITEAHNSGWSSHQKLYKNDDFTGSYLRGGSYKQGKMPVPSADNRRDTYNQFHLSAAVSNSVFSTFDVEKKMLLPVGLHAEYGYARSLARFAAGLGPVAWDIASKKIEKSLPPEVKFGPGWVGHDDVNAQQPLLINPSLSGQAGASDPVSLPSAPSSSAIKIPGDKSAYQQEGDDSLGYQLASTIAALDFHPAAAAAISIPSLSTRPLESAAQASVVTPPSPEGQTHLPQSSSQRSSFQFQPQVPSPIMRMSANHSSNQQPQLNQHQLNMQLKMNPLGAQLLQIPTGFTQNQNYSQMANIVSRTSAASDHTNLFLTNRSPVANFFSTPDSTSTTKLHRFHPETISASAPPPDLNLQFPSPASPSIDSKQPDLALQL